MIFDLHIHTEKYSDCSFINPEDLLRQAAEAGLHGLALTEHGMRWPDREFEKLRKLAETHKLVLLNGQEIYTADQKRRTEGEFLVFGLQKSLTQTYTARELIDRVKDEDGIVIAAHPYKLSRNGRTRYYGAGDGIYGLKVDALELFHPDHNENALKKAREAMAALGIPGTGGSDAHKIFNVGACVTVFENDIHTESEFLREIKKGHFRSEKRFDSLSGHS